MLALSEGEPEALAAARLRETAALREGALLVGLCESSTEGLAGAVSLAEPLLKRVTLALGEAAPEALPAPPAVAVTSPPLLPLRVAQSEGATEDDAEGLPGCAGEVLGCAELLEEAIGLEEGEARRLLLRVALSMGWREALGQPLGQRVARELALTLGEAVTTEGVPLRVGRGEGVEVSERAGDREPEALAEGAGEVLDARLGMAEDVELNDAKAECELLGHEEPLGVPLALREAVSVSESVALACEEAL